MFACPHCDNTDYFLAYRDGTLYRVLEDNQDVEGLSDVGELLCSECNQWFANPSYGQESRAMTGELVTITGLKGTGTIKVVATGITFPFHYASYQDDAARVLAGESASTVEDLLEFAGRRDHTLGLRVKEDGNPNTWVYRLNRRALRKALGR